MTVSAARRRKLDKLRADLAGLGGALVAFSGGTDSTLLLKVAADVLGDAVLAVTAASPLYPGRETVEARRLARRLGVRHRVIRTTELRNPAFAANPPLRCYHCKRELFATLRRIADAAGLRHVLDGSNADDAADYRPGARAGRELKVRSPLRDAGLTKADVRALSRALRLPTWDKPALACLASRFPYGDPIDAAGLARVGRAEDALRRLGFREVRVRHHGPVARVELAPGEIGRLTDAGLRAKISRRLKSVGYAYVALDLDGYRTGSLNETLGKERRRRTGGAR